MLCICKFGRSRSRTSNIWLHCSNWLLCEPFVKNPKSSQTIVNLISSNIDEFNCFNWNLHDKSACIWAKEWRQLKKIHKRNENNILHLDAIKTRHRPLSLLCSFLYFFVTLFFFLIITMLHVFFAEGSCDVIINSYSSRTRRIWADIYNQRGRRPSWLLSAHIRQVREE